MIYLKIKASNPAFREACEAADKAARALFAARKAYDEARFSILNGA